LTPHFEAGEYPASASIPAFASYCGDSSAKIGSQTRGWRQEFLMRRLAKRFIADQSGATAIEYCLIAAGLSIVIVTAVNGIGATLNGKFSSINSSLK
jgi:pilus assembly protein Flp/PilA